MREENPSIIAAPPAAAPPVPPASADPAPLAHIPLFASLSLTEQRDLMEAMYVERVEPHTTIFWQGEKGDKFYLVSRGSVEISVPNEDGVAVKLADLVPGGFFGEISLLDGGVRTATARTTAATELYVLGRAQFHEFLRRHPRVAIEVINVMGRRQRASIEALRTLKNPNQTYAETHASAWHRFSDQIVASAGRQGFLTFHVIWFAVWVGVNLLSGWGWLPRAWSWDPFPFGLLTMIVSLEAIFLSIFVLVSQNRQTEKDRLRTDLDYQVNIKALAEIMSMARRLEQIESHVTPRAPAANSRGAAESEPA